MENLPRLTPYLLKAFRGQGNEAKWFLKIKVPTINRFEIRAAQLQPTIRWQQNIPYFAAICWLFVSVLFCFVFCSTSLILSCTIHSKEIFMHVQTTMITFSLT